ncbi:protein of unknown function [Xenorhabdus poinarii G6]|uniref:Tc1-like transposase DDE domain-containing protein n=1 Tax=Xenorhabdus poinarii G6 TaxID=1354304 RepID=A0A068R638_9GAMM|nr:protein of unknown function [Xenorhabdus poinarii G6]
MKMLDFSPTLAHVNNHENSSLTANLMHATAQLDLPPYSPNLNPIERLWKYANEQIRNNVYFPDENVP